MRLSMRIFEHHLADLRPMSMISEGQRSIVGIRRLAGAVHSYDDYLYLSRGDEYILDGTARRTLLINRNDVIEIRNADFEDVLNRVLAIMQLYAELEDRLFAAIYEPDPEQAVVSCCEGLVGPTFVMGQAADIIACSQNYSNLFVNEYWDGFVTARRMSADTVYAQRSGTFFRLAERRQKLKPFVAPDAMPYGYGVMNSYCDAQGDVIGQLIVSSNAPVTPYDVQMTEIIGDALTRVQQNRFATGTRLETDGAQFELVLSGELSASALQVFMAKRGWTAAWEFVVISLIPSTPIGEVAQKALCDQLRLDEKDIAVGASGAGVAVLVARRRQGEAARRRLLGSDSRERRIADKLLSFAAAMSLRLGASNPFSDLAACPLAMEQADFAALHRAGRPAFDDGDLPQFFERAAIALSHHRSKEFLDFSVHPALGAYRSYDMENGSEIYRTVFEYIRCERSVKKACLNLHVHRNTVLYRIERAQAIYPVDLESPDERLYLLVSFLHFEQ